MSDIAHGGPAIPVEDRADLLGGRPPTDDPRGLEPARRAALADAMTRGVAAAMDLAMLRMMMTEARYPEPEALDRVRREVDATHAHLRRAGALDAPARFHPRPPPPRTVHIRPSLHAGGLCGRLSFPSGYRARTAPEAAARWDGYEANQTAHAWLLRHRDGADRPWVVCLHGLGTGSPWMDFPAFRALHLHRDHGLNLLFPLLPLHGPRRGPGMVRGSMLSFELVDTVSALGQAVWDVRRLLAWARHEGARRIVLYGLSVGAYTAALVSALEDVDLVLCGIPLSDIPTLFARHTPEHFRTLAHHFDLAGPQVQEMFRPVSPLTLLPRVALARRRIYAGLADRVTPPSQAEQLWEAWGRPSIEWFDGGHLSAQWSGQVDRFVDSVLEGHGLSQASAAAPTATPRAEEARS